MPLACRRSPRALLLPRQIPLSQSMPIFESMGIAASLNLCANLVCLRLLFPFRNDDLNMASMWECSRNDIATNTSVFVAAGGVWLTGSAWPDLLVASALWLLLMRSSIRVVRSALRASRDSVSTLPEEDPHGT